PRLAAVLRLEQPGARPPLHLRVAAREAVAAHAVTGRIEDVRLLRVDCDVDEAGVLVEELDLLPGLAAVRGLVDTALLVRPPETSQGGNVDGVWVLRVNDDAADVVRFLQAHVLPGFAAVGGLVDAVAPGDAVARVRLARPHPDDLRVRRGDGHVPQA